ncbi:MAG TPA: hypothetical protein VFY90_12875 [Tepidiformaceae bacterium]|nr:hypothetical protein [Tepidiformaceae bacterium]
MTDRRPDRVYGILVREGRVFLAAQAGELGLPGGVFRPLAEDRKVELKAHLWDQLGIEAGAIWAQGAFDYRAPGEDREYFSGFYTVWDWAGDVPEDAGIWTDVPSLAGTALVPSLKILLTSVLNTQALRTR